VPDLRPADPGAGRAAGAAALRHRRVRAGVRPLRPGLAPVREELPGPLRRDAPVPGSQRPAPPPGVVTALLPTAGRSTAPTVVLAGALAQRPGIGGHAWVFRHWLAGLAALGCDVVFVDRLEPAMLDDPAAPPESSPQWAWLERVMAGAGMEGRFAVLVDGGRRSLGLDRAALVERCRRAAVLFNVMGYLDD